jgi:hypothetical protein
MHLAYFFAQSARALIRHTNFFHDPGDCPDEGGGGSRSTAPSATSLRQILNASSVSGANSSSGSSLRFDKPCSW